MKLQVSELAKLTGVSVRTLHYYDTIGLLKPAEVDKSTGYRFYDETSLEKLKQILYYRELDFAKVLGNLFDPGSTYILEIQPYELFMEALENVMEVV